MKNKKMNILVLGHARHGKDTFAKLLYPECKETSILTLETFLFDKIKRDEPHLKYENIESAFSDRVNHRKYWYDEIMEYNKARGWTGLAKEVYKRQPIYVGMRADIEYQSCLREGLFDLIFWVDRSKVLPLESEESMTIKYDPIRMVYIDNNSTECNLIKIGSICRAYIDGLL